MWIRFIGISHNVSCFVLVDGCKVKHVQIVCCWGLFHCVNLWTCFIIISSLNEYSLWAPTLSHKWIYNGGWVQILSIAIVFCGYMTKTMRLRWGQHDQTRLLTRWHYTKWHYIIQNTKNIIISAVLPSFNSLFIDSILTIFSVFICLIALGKTY
jgi:hypothetical protein